ncbi:hypothetical protein JCM5350_005872 [Sporobolomyces pararoseus]
MTDPQYVPFTSRTRLPGNFNSAEYVFDEVHKLLHNPFSQEDLDSLIGRLDEIAVEHGVDDDEIPYFKSFYTAEINRIPVPVTVEANASFDYDSLPQEMHPLLRSHLVDKRTLTHNRDAWFIPTGQRNAGNSRRKRAVSNSTPRNVRPTAAELNATPGDSNDPAVEPMLEDPVVDAGDNEESLADLSYLSHGGGLGGPSVASALRSGPQSSTPLRPLVLGQAPPRSVPSSRTAVVPTRRPRSDSLDVSRIDPHSHSHYYDAVLAALGEHLPDDDEELPSWVRYFRSQVLERRLKFSGKAGKAELNKAWTAIAANVKMSVQDIQRVALDEMVDFTSLRDYKPEVTNALDPGVSELLDGLRGEERKKVRSAPLDFYLWKKYFDLWCLVSRLVNVGATTEEGRQLELDRQKAYTKYGKFITDQFEAHPQSEVRARIVYFDTVVRTHLATPNGGEIKHFGRVGTNEALWHALVTTPSSNYASSSTIDAYPPSSSTSKKSRSKKPEAPRIEFDHDSVYCGRWNWGRKCDGCERLHKCSACDGSHREKDCPTSARGKSYRGGNVKKNGAGNGGKGTMGTGGGGQHGLGPAPRFLRTLHWPVTPSPPRTPLLDSTYSASPLPRPPPFVEEDPLYLDALRRFPHLFSTFSPINVDALRLALQHHPNRAWVTSLLTSLIEGFWPLHDGSDPVPPKPHQISLYPSRPEDQLVLEENARKSFEDGIISPAIDQLPLGAVVSPQFVVRREGSEPRPVDDHTASGLNNGISSAPAVYDRIPDLLSHLRHLGMLNSSSAPSHWTLWKMDVSSAFKILLMHRAWQFRQGIAVAYRTKNGKVQVRYHLQWRAAFGSRASPSLWTTFMGAVLWVIQQRYQSVVPHPLAYMDDLYSCDTTGQLVYRSHGGESRLIPPGMAATVDVWHELGIPFKWKKALFGRALVIIGIELNLDTLEISLPRENVLAFAREVAAFVVERKHPIRRWRQLCGWANWALTVIPLARPYLSPVFAKLSYKNGAPRSPSPFTIVFVNVEVRESLNSFVQELVEGPKLNLREPLLLEWGRGDEDVMVQTDACLGCDDDSNRSGLGFWFDADGTRHFFFSRPRIRYKQIRFAEGLVVAHVIHYFASLPSPPKRLLIRTDSSPVVYAFDSGKAIDSPFVPMRTLVLLSIIAYRKAKMDVRVVHVSGKSNETADQLSRLRMATPVVPRTVTFAPRHSRAPTRPKEPLPSLSSLLSERQQLWDAAIEPSTLRAYRATVKRWNEFTFSFSLPEFPSPHSLSLYVTFRLRRCVSSTVIGDLSALAYHFGGIDKKRFVEARQAVEVTRALTGGAKLNPHASKKALPLPLSVLSDTISRHLQPSSPYDLLLWSAMAVVAFFSCARAQELTTYDQPEFRNELKYCRRDTVNITGSGFSVHLPYHKADRLFSGSKLWFASVDAGSLFTVLRSYLVARDHLFGSSGYLWSRADGSVPTRRWFVDLLKKFCGKQFTGHSFRAGGATWYALRGTADRRILQIGRWRSDAWEEYVRMQPEIAIATRTRDTNLLPADPSLLPSFSSVALGSLLART